MSLTFIDYFAGVGGFRLGMEAAGHRCNGYVEINKAARKSYEAIHNTKGEWTAHDITEVDYRDIPPSDVWCFGFPCQDISVGNGNPTGFEGERSSLFFAVTRLLRQTKEWSADKLPSYLLIENVKNFLSVNDGWDFLAAQIELDEIGYDIEWDVLNSSDFGVPQHRERVFMVGHLRGRSTRKVFPIARANILSFEGDAIEVRPCLTPKRNKRQQGRRFKTSGEPSFTVNTVDKHGVAVKVLGEWKVRELTPREAWRLQGFPDWVFDKAAAVSSESSLYKQAGNGVTVNVIKAIAEKL